jgi:hypothetical protein
MTVTQLITQVASLLTSIIALVMSVRAKGVVNGLAARIEREFAKSPAPATTDPK